jgi:PAS domain S-box-containing protein
METVRILLVEDDVVDVMAFERHVQAENLPYEHRVASSISEARELLAAESFDIVLLDYLMSDGTGFDLLSGIGTIPVVFVTGGGGEEVAIRAMKEGAYDYLIKGKQHDYLKVLPITVRNAVEHWKVKRAYEESLEQLRQERNLFISGPVVAFKWSKEPYHPVMYVSPNVIQFGYKTQDFIDGHIRYQDIILPEDMPKMLQHSADHVVQGTPFYETEYRIVLPDGRIRWVYDFTVVIRNRNNEIQHFEGYLLDITDRKQAELEKEKLIDDLKKALEEINTLRGILPICVGCKKIRDDQGYWHQVEAYIHAHSGVEFSHGLCPDCAKRLYPGFFKDKDDTSI